MKILSQTKKGKVFNCSKCDALHVEYLNLNFNLTAEEYFDFAKYIDDIDGKKWEKTNGKSCFKRKIIIPIGNKKFNLLLNNEELIELKCLLSFRSYESEKQHFKAVCLGEFDLQNILN
ncbi:MAG: hypothetical protein N4A49_00550 [Marinifilaceae bacterium]|jgi:hypothetical protein|nr:hypothetical protein [Marinifilaceae bacterium]